MEIVLNYCYKNGKSNIFPYFQRNFGQKLKIKWKFGQKTKKQRIFAKLWIFKLVINTNLFLIIGRAFLLTISAIYILLMLSL